MSAITITAARLANAAGTAVLLTTVERGAMLLSLPDPRQHAEDVRGAYDAWVAAGNTPAGWPMAVPVDGETPA